MMSPAPTVGMSIPVIDQFGAASVTWARLERSVAAAAQAAPVQNLPSETRCSRTSVNVIAPGLRNGWSTTVPPIVGRALTKAPLAGVVTAVTGGLLS